MRTALVAIASQSERPYIDEWLEYHRLLGFQEAYITLDGWEYDGTFAGVHWLHISQAGTVPQGSPRHVLQMEAYNAFLDGHAAFDWAAFIDIDEFVVVRDATLREFLGRFQDAPGVCLNWRMFGDSGLSFNGDTRVLERFFRCSAVLSPEAKTILNLRRCGEARFQWMHAPTCWRGILNATGRHSMDDDTHSFMDLDECCGVAYLAHFYTKTRAEFEKKVESGRGWSDDGGETGKQRRMRLFDIYREGEATDTSARDFFRESVYKKKQNQKETQ